jgi:hypothetical protein
MARYFLILDGAEFHDSFRPALAASWRGRSFAPCRALCARLLPRARDFAARYHLGSDEPLLARVVAGLAFDRTFWHHLVGEVLWYGAVGIPEVQIAEEAWTCLVPPITKALRGSHDLVFGGGFYRPDQAGWNDVDDVQRLAAYLSTVDTSAWRPEDLASLTEVTTDERTEELADAREWFPAFAALYRQAADERRIVVCETL